MKKLKPLLLLLALCFMLSAGMKCKKDSLLDPNGLPKATQTGAMMFACKLNGENWIAKNSIYNMGGIIKKDTLVISSHMDNQYYESFSIHLYNKIIKENVVYKLNDRNNQFALYISDKNCFLNYTSYNYGEAVSTDGEIIFTKINKEQTTLSGTFWFTTPTDKCGTLKITEGRFDINIGYGKFLL